MTNAEESSVVLAQLADYIETLEPRDLTVFRRQVEECFRKRHEALIETKRELVLQIAADIGMSPAELLGIDEIGPRKRDGRAGRKVDMTKQPWWVDPTGENDPGRRWGPRPKWVTALIESGQYREEDLLKPADWRPSAE